MDGGPVTELAAGIWRVTFALPLGIDHVHCYVLRAEDGSLTVVDTGLGLDDAQARWRSVLGSLPGRVERIVITHFHPDHVGAARDVARLTGAPVFQGALDYEQCVRVFGDGDASVRFLDYLREHGMPEQEVEDVLEAGRRLRRHVRFAIDPGPLAAGDRIAGWDVLHLPGHADGHLALLRDGILVAGDALLATISPNVGLYPDSRPDPLADYLGSLERIVELAPARAFAGHGEPMDDPAGRARELIAHHEERLEHTHRAIREEPLDAYRVSLALFPDALSPTLRRFALAETRAHLERLVADGRAARLEGRKTVEYAAGG